MILKLVILVLLLSGCAIVTTSDEYPDGRKSFTHAAELGRTEAIKGFTDVQTKDGRAIGVNEATADVNVKALSTGIQGLGEFAGALLKAYSGNPQ